MFITFKRDISVADKSSIRFHKSILNHKQIVNIHRNIIHKPNLIFHFANLDKNFNYFLSPLFKSNKGESSIGAKEKNNKVKNVRLCIF